MSYYGIQLPEYWTGLTGRAIQQRGGKDATLLGAYVTSAPRANMIGLYRLPLRDVVDHTPLTEPEAFAAFLILAEEEFAYYDPATEFIWVKTMARFRLGLKPDRPQLAKDDKRVAGARRIYESVPANPWLFAFFQTYKNALWLEKRRGAPVKPLISPLVGAMEALGLAGKPVNRSTGTEDLTVKIPGAERREFSTPVEISFTHYRKAAHDALERSLTEDQSDNYGNIAEWFKRLCAERQFPYTSEIARKAIDAVLAAREKRAVSA